MEDTRRLLFSLATVAAILLSMNSVQARDRDSSIVKSTTEAQSVAYVEVATWGFSGSASLNYEYSPAKNVWLRSGIGIGYIVEFDEQPHHGLGPMLMALYLSEGNNKIEFGVGTSLMYGLNGDRLLRAPAVVGNWWLVPAISLGYRYQPVHGGILYRVGVTFDYYYGTPVQFSMGYAF